MTIFQFIASLVGSLAWPLTTLVLILIFHRSILGLLEKVRQFEGWGIKASFGHKVERLVEDTARAGLLPPPTPLVAPPAQAMRQAVQAEAGGSIVDLYPSPQEIISGGWATIERALERASAGLDIQALAHKSYYVIAKGGDDVLGALMVADRLRFETVLLVERAQSLRYSVMYGRKQPDLGEAILYANSARSIAQAILKEAGIGDEALN